MGHPLATLRRCKKSQRVFLSSRARRAAPTDEFVFHYRDVCCRSSEGSRTQAEKEQSKLIRACCWVSSFCCWLVLAHGLLTHGSQKDGAQRMAEQPALESPESISKKRRVPLNGIVDRSASVPGQFRMACLGRCDHRSDNECCSPTINASVVLSNLRERAP